MTELAIYDEWVFDHARYAGAREALLEEVDLVLQGGPRMIAMLLGPSGMGKTELIVDLVASFEDRLTETGHPLVLHVSFPAGSTADALAACIIKKIRNIRLVKGSGAERRESAIGLLQDSGIQVLILDETNHAAEARATRATQTKANRLTADWIKQIFDRAKVSVVMAGLSHSLRLLTDNDQLEGRALRPIEMKPYAWHIDADRKAFRDLVAAFSGQAIEHGWTLDINEDRLSRAAYLASRGLVRPVARLFERAVIVTGKGGTLTEKVFARAYDKCLPERQIGNPFELEEITDEMLNAAHRQLLQKINEPMQDQDRGRRT
ncbi:MULTISPECIES: TniB family NTP-binding protein [Ramlibacter]|uniref:AAA family ATPase n=1 Tax=Ramlibacter pinisoli TaxID=2682844 RepID=A0A6N8INF4_9BURK|nr:MULTISPECIES: TniB family NTP-binding protein [Ramlibacter]MBA2960518.1 TniB family NTP-binding protein [Ramlibacter sp. CGMCC 1.13660]MVQ27850.1 AAA family ATPase [Ramlibacter pinisoli]